MTRVVLDPTTRQTIDTDERYRKSLRALAGSLYEGLASLMTETVGVKDDSYVGGLLQKIYELDQDVWNLIEQLDERRYSRDSS